MSTFCCEFLGCKVNQYDAERARRILFEHGLREQARDAALVLVASCTVTARAAGKGRQALRSLLRRHPEARVAVLGCMSEEDRRFYRSVPREVTILPSAQDDDFPRLLRPLAMALAPPGPRAGPGVYRPRRTRAFLKVEDGCDLRCTFCIIPLVRGPARSRTLHRIREELVGLLAQGVREVVLTGIHLGHYGRRGDTDLEQLLQVLVAVPGEFRLRLSSLEVSELSERLLDLVTGSARIVPHLHLPLQSGSDAVLRRMRRPYDATTFRTAVGEVRRRLEDAALTTDVMVGFPGETEQDFRDTLELCEEAGFSRIHVFPFSARDGTPAATLPDRVAPALVRERKARLFQLGARLRGSALGRRIGLRERVLLEECAGDDASGLDERYHRVQVRTAAGLAAGELVEVRVIHSTGEELVAEPVGVRQRPAGVP